MPRAPTDIFSRAAATYDSVGPRHFTHFARKLVGFADIEPGSRVLDVATGAAAVLLAAAEQVTGEPAAKSLDAAPENGELPEGERAGGLPRVALGGSRLDSSADAEP